MKKSWRIINEMRNKSESYHFQIISLTPMYNWLRIDISSLKNNEHYINLANNNAKPADDFDDFKSVVKLRWAAFQSI